MAPRFRGGFAIVSRPPANSRDYPTIPINVSLSMPADTVVLASVPARAAGLFIFVSCTADATPSTAKTWSGYFALSFHCLRASRRPSPHQYRHPKFALQKPNHEAILGKTRRVGVAFRSVEFFPNLQASRFIPRLQQDGAKSRQESYHSRSCRNL